MNHEEWQTLVSAYYDDQVTAAERAQVEAHLAECAECRALLADCRRLGQAIHDLPRGEPSRMLWPRVQAKLPRRQQPIWRRLLPVTSAVAMLVVGITIVAVLRMSQLGAVQPLMQKEVAEPRRAVLPTSLDVPAAPRPAGTQSDTLRLESVGGSDEGTPQPCPGAPLAMEVVSLSVTHDAALVGPQVRGVLYDAAGRPAAGATLVISGTAGWQGLATTSNDGTFVLDLPAAGPYRVIWGWGAADLPEQQREKDTTWNSYLLPDSATCPLPPSLEMAPVTLAANEVLVITLRLR